MSPLLIRNGSSKDWRSVHKLSLLMLLEHGIYIVPTEVTWTAWPWRWRALRSY